MSTEATLLTGHSIGTCEYWEQDLPSVPQLDSPGRFSVILLRRIEFVLALILAAILC